MAGKQSEETPQAPVISQDQFAALIGQAVAQGIVAANPKELKEGDPEYVARQRAEGWFDDFFGVTVFQNAYEANARGETEQTRKRASQLKPGKYIKTPQNPDGRVTVEVLNGGSIVRLLYPISGDNNSINRDYFRSFKELVDKMWDEMHVPVPA
jgi:hypothetical protein